MSSRGERIYGEWKIGGRSISRHISVSGIVDRYSARYILRGSSDEGGINEARSARIQLRDENIAVGMVGSGSNRKIRRKGGARHINVTAAIHSHADGVVLACAAQERRVADYGVDDQLRRSVVIRKNEPNPA